MTPNKESKENLLFNAILRLNSQAIGLGLGLALPALLLLVGSGTAVWIAAAASHLVGVLAIRWLFFADARHVMSLYYAR